MPDPHALPPFLHSWVEQTLPPGSTDNAALMAIDLLSSKDIRLLRKALPDLKEHHNVQVIGIDLPSYLNVLFWAYQDGELATLCGSPSKARDYVTTLCGNLFSSQNGEAQAKLALDALDRGIRVIAYDAQSISQLPDALHQLYPDSTVPPEQWDKAGTQLLQWLNTDGASLTHSQVLDDVRIQFLKTCLELKPEYKNKAIILEAFMAEAATNSLGHNALNALLLEAAQDTGNILALAHLDQFLKVGLDRDGELIDANLPESLAHIVLKPAHSLHVAAYAVGNAPRQQQLENYFKRQLKANIHPTENSLERFSLDFVNPKEASVVRIDLDSTQGGLRNYIPDIYQNPNPLSIPGIATLASEISHIWQAAPSTPTPASSSKSRTR